MIEFWINVFTMLQRLPMKLQTNYIIKNKSNSKCKAIIEISKHNPTNYAHATSHLETNFKCLLMGLCKHYCAFAISFVTSFGCYLCSLDNSDLSRF